jgi:SMC interacting uncharacterized protein involved in chromosome segregation
MNNQRNPWGKPYCPPPPVTVEDFEERRLNQQIEEAKRRLDAIKEKARAAQRITEKRETLARLLRDIEAAGG